MSVVGSLKSLVLVLFICALLFEPIVVNAGFGITPPYLRNTSLTRNAVYEQEILLVRGSAATDLTAEITVDAPEVSDWIEIIGGNEIALPAGEQKIPMKVRVTVPRDAEFKEYSGRIRVRTQPTDEQIRQGAVNISLGAQINVELNVIDRVIRDFRIRRINLPDLNEGRKLAWLYFPGKIQFGMRLENTGNIDISPSEVKFEIYDVRGTTLLETTSNIGRIEKVQPYATENIVANIPTRLPAGNYIARYTIYNDGEVNQTGELNMSILEYGTLQEAGFGLSGLSLPHQISIALPILSLLILLLYLFYLIRYRKRKK